MVVEDLETVGCEVQWKGREGEERWGGNGKGSEMEEMESLREWRVGHFLLAFLDLFSLGGFWWWYTLYGEYIVHST